MKVTLIEPSDGLLPFLDREPAEEFRHDMRERGMTLRFLSTVAHVERRGVGCHGVREDSREIGAGMVLFAAGRRGATASLGLEHCGLSVDARGRLRGDRETFRTDVPHIFAVGDVIGFPSLASTAMAQGRIAARHAFDEPASAPPEFFSYGLYAAPELSTVSLNEEQARAKRIAYETGVARFGATARGHIMGLNSGFLRMIFARETRRLLGVHIVGEGATELVHIGQAVRNLGGTLDYFVDNTSTIRRSPKPTRSRRWMRIIACPPPNRAARLSRGWSTPGKWRPAPAADRQPAAAANVTPTEM